jgi:hypothetical protein
MKTLLTRLDAKFEFQRVFETLRMQKRKEDPREGAFSFFFVLGVI